MPLNNLDVLTFWFSHESRAKWFLADPTFDTLIRNKFLGLYEKARKKELFSYQESAQGSLALIILLDQFSRNMFRGHPQAFASDSQVLDIMRKSMKAGLDQTLNSEDQKIFMYMPLMHSETLQDQDDLLTLLKNFTNKKTLDYAHQHRDIIARFGRFPHRNKILGRASTLEEEAFLQQPFSSF